MREPEACLPLLEVEALTVEYCDQRTGAIVRAVEDVSFSLPEGEIVGICGEASSGKTTLVEAVVGALPRQGRITEGKITLFGRHLASMSESERRRMRGATLAYIPSGGHEHLNPVKEVGSQIGAVLRAHQKLSRKEACREVESLLERIGIDSPHERAEAYPHELSGGMAQRVAIAMGLACRPRIVLADEPTGGLDVTVQANILDLLSSLLKNEGTAGIIVSRDLGVITNYCTRLFVMQNGRIVDTATIDEFLTSPGTGYSKRLIEIAREADRFA